MISPCVVVYFSSLVLLNLVGKAAAVFVETDQLAQFRDICHEFAKRSLPCGWLSHRQVWMSALHQGAATPPRAQRDAIEPQFSRFESSLGQLESIADFRGVDVFDDVTNDMSHAIGPLFRYVLIVCS